MPPRRGPSRASIQVVSLSLSAVAVLSLALRGAPTTAAAQDLRAATDGAAQGSHEARSGAVGAASAPGAPDAAPPASPAAPALPTDRVTLAFAGDVHGERQIAAALAAGEDVLGGMADVLGAADLALVNLETPVGSRSAPAAKAYTFLAPPALLDALVGAGVDVVTVANNHALDHGIDGLQDTLRVAAERGLVVVGGGQDAAAASAPFVLDRGGLRVAVLGLSRVLPHHGWTAGPRSPGLASGYDVARAVDAVRAARAAADHVVVAVHWGTERQACPDPTQVTLARALHEAGATVVVGSHPHVFQGIAQPRPDQLTAYSLGNFLWYATSTESGRTGVLTVTLDRTGVVDVSVAPARIGADGQPRPADADDADRLQRAISTRVPGAGCPADGARAG